MSRRSNRSLDGSTPVITGLGAVSSIGIGAEVFWEAVQAGTSGARPVRSFDTEGLRNRIGCEVQEPLPDPPGNGNGDGMPRASRLAVAAAAETLVNAGLEADAIDALCVGTTMGELPDIESELAHLDDPASARASGRVLQVNFARRIAAALGVSGPALTVATSCSAGNIAIFRAADLIREGSAERVLAGGADAFSRVAFIGFSRMRAMAPERCSPFAAGRRGMLLGEGSAFLALESLSSARARGARIYAAVLGYGLSCDAHHIATPESKGRGAAAAIGGALADAGLDTGDVDYVCAHGTGTQANDLAESRACRTIFGDGQPYISSLKALLGHPLGAASALEAVASVLSLRDQRLIPAWHVDQPDDRCGVRLPLPDNDRRPPRLDVVLSNAFAFGGNNSCLALERCS